MYTFAQTIEGWHDFYVLMGTAAATLVGLLFIGLTLNIERLRRDRYGDIRMLASRTFGSFIYVVLIAAVFLIPDQVPLGVGLPLLFMSSFGLLNTIRNIVAALRSKQHVWGIASIVRRFILLLVAFAGLLIIAVSVLMGNTNSLYWLTGVILALLASASWNAWDILTRIRETG